MSYTCNHCGGKFCSDHRLPEAHTCPGEGNFVRTKHQQRTGNTSYTRPGAPSGETISNYDDSSLLTWLWLPVGLLLIGVRTVFSYQGLKTLFAAAIFLVGFSAFIGTGYQPIDSEVNGVISDIQSGISNSGAGSFFESSNTDSVNETKVELAIHTRVNEIRASRGLDPLSYDTELSAIASNHSKDMANRSNLSHVSADGKTLEDRYAEAGYRCRVKTITGYSGGSENAAKTFAAADIIRDDGEEVNYYGNEIEIAHGIVRQWMNSKGHRENILKPYWNDEGIGVATVNEDGKTAVYATQNFC